MCHESGSYFQKKNSEKGMSIFHKLGSVTLMEQITKRMKTELTDYFHLVWTKKSTNLEIALKMGAIFFQNSPQNRILETSNRHKNSEKGPIFSSKIPERVKKSPYSDTPCEKIMSPPRDS